jgi:hypothetical protein
VPTVAYRFQFPYRYSPAGEPFPILPVVVTNPRQHSHAVDAIAYLDSGAQRSLFDGTVARVIGLDLLAGRRLQFASPAGMPIEAMLHTVRLSHPELGDFDLAVGFSTAPLRRNLLGRDFFNLVQIGFRERHELFYITPRP